MAAPKRIRCEPTKRKAGRPPAGPHFSQSEIAFYRAAIHRLGWNYSKAADRLKVSESQLHHLLAVEGQPVGVTLATREKFTQVLGAVPDGSGLRPTHETRLPEDCWPILRLRIGGKEYTPKIKVIARSKTGMRVTLRDTRYSWEPPPGFQGYADFRDSQWAVNPNAYDADRWHVARWRTSGNPSDCVDLKIELKTMRYRDVVATSTPGGLAKVVKLDDGTERTVREWLAADRSWSPCDSEPYPRAANSLTTNVLVITADNQAVISRQGRGNLVSQGVWVASSSGQVERDDFEHGLLSAKRAGLRETQEEIGMSAEIGLDVKSLRWLGAMVRLDMGWCALLGEVAANIPSARVREAFDNHRSADKPMEIDFVDLNPSAVASFLDSRNCGVVLSFHLWLALWARDHAVSLDEALRNTAT